MRLESLIREPTAAIKSLLLLSRNNITATDNLAPDGVAGQVLTSRGPTQPPSWQTPATGTASTSWASITGTPSTLSGYGILDSFTQTQINTILSAYYTSAQVDTLLTAYYTSAQVDVLLAGYQPLDSDLTAIAALATTAYGRGLLELVDAAAARTYIGAAATVHTHVTADITNLAAYTGLDVRYYTEAEVDAFIAGRQPLDADLTAIAALATAAFGRGLLERTTAADTRTYIDAAQTAHTHVTADITNLAAYTGLDVRYFTEAEVTALLAGYQPLDSDLTAIAALTTTSFGRGFLALADAAAAATYIGAVTLSAANVFTAIQSVSVSSWLKIALITTTVTARARMGSDANGLNFTTNALFNGAWVEDDTAAKKFAYIQHIGNGRHEFRTAVAGAGVTWINSLTLTETAAVFIGSVAATVGVFGTDPGGSELLRVGGAFRVSGAGVIGTTLSFGGSGDTLFLNNNRAAASASIVFLAASGANDVRLSSNNDGTLRTTSQFIGTIFNVPLIGSGGQYNINSTGALWKDATFTRVADWAGTAKVAISTTETYFDNSVYYFRNAGGSLLFWRMEAGSNNSQLVSRNSRISIFETATGDATVQVSDGTATGQFRANGLRVFVGSESAHNFGLVAGGAERVTINASTGAVVVGSDPGGSELLRVGGAIRSNNIIYSASGFYVTANAVPALVVTRSIGGFASVVRQTSDALTRFLAAEGTFQWTDAAESAEWAAMSSTFFRTSRPFDATNGITANTIRVNVASGVSRSINTTSLGIAGATGQPLIEIRNTTIPASYFISGEAIGLQINGGGTAVRITPGLGLDGNLSFISSANRVNFGTAAADFRLRSNSGSPVALEVTRVDESAYLPFRASILYGFNNAVLGTDPGGSEVLRVGGGALLTTDAFIARQSFTASSGNFRHAKVITTTTATTPSGTAPTGTFWARY